VLLTFIIIFKKKIRISFTDFIKLFFCGFLISIHWVFFFKAIKVSNVSVTLSILSLGAFLTSFLEPIFYKKSVVNYEVVLGLVVALGTAIVFKTQFHYLEGIIYALFAVIFSVFFTLFNGKIIKRVPSLTISLFELMSGFLLLTIILLLRGELDYKLIELS